MHKMSFMHFKIKKKDFLLAESFGEKTFRKKILKIALKNALKIT